MPASRSISRSSSTNGTRSSAASALPSVVLPAPRRPTSATRLRRDAASSPKSRISRNTTSSRRCAGSPSRKRRMSRCSTERSRGVEQLGQRHVERARDAAQQQHRRVAFARFELREVALRDAGALRDGLARHAAPLARLADLPPHRGEELRVVRSRWRAARKREGGGEAWRTSRDLADTEGVRGDEIYCMSLIDVKHFGSDRDARSMAIRLRRIVRRRFAASRLLT